MTSHARWTVLTCEIVGRSSGSTSVSCDPCGMSSPWTTVAVPSVGSDSHDAKPGILIPPVTSPSEFSLPSSVSGTSLSVTGTSSMAANLVGWLLYTQRAERVTDTHLDRDRHGGDGERDQEPETVVAVATTTQHAHGVDGCDEEPADDVGGDDHVGGHQRHGVVEDHLQRIDVDHLASAVERESLR